jgi:hypothetical protein
LDLGQRNLIIVTTNRTEHSRAGSSLGDESFANNLIMFTALPYIQRMRDAIVPKPRGFTVIGVFLFFGAVMAAFAATTLLRRGTPLDRLVSQSDSVQPARASGRYCWDILPGACRDSYHGRDRVVPTPSLGMETSGRNYLDTGSRGCR